MKFDIADICQLIYKSTSSYRSMVLGAFTIVRFFIYDDCGILEFYNPLRSIRPGDISFTDASKALSSKVTGILAESLLDIRPSSPLKRTSMIILYFFSLEASIFIGTTNTGELYGDLDGLIIPWSSSSVICFSTSSFIDIGVINCHNILRSYSEIFSGSSKRFINFQYSFCTFFHELNSVLLPENSQRDLTTSAKK
ncbi:hypothetical protein FF38_02164 [Lucilia cuprina]|uniref:Uncharacterized protein n=1 Tax=Lucilia cuprina TaxID=7375 RepID=A0A0L0CRH0_LUCCU|nr:hypothetical protein FF38_02164 [Lucilia cuprina]